LQKGTKDAEISKVLCTFGTMKIVILGSGNVGTHLHAALRDAGHEILQVWHRGEKIVPGADVYVICVKDDAISSVAEQVRRSGVLEGNGKHVPAVVHTAGSVPMGELSGVLYPMQSFTKSRKVNFREIPIFVEASDEHSRKIITALANSISDIVKDADSATRKKLHLAAVFASNLSNHCYRLAEKLVEKEGLDFKLFGPLIMETAAKACMMSPKDAQTGPMRRGDTTVIKNQMAMIDDHLTREIYRIFYESIKRDY
jgi:predicted short-subunit dehydrogenase-like oxidoreductase (DUF2520 family)